MRKIVNILLITVILVTIRFKLLIDFNIAISNIEIYSALGLTSVLQFITRAIRFNIVLWINEFIRLNIGTVFTTRFLLIFFLVTASLSLLVSSVEVSWYGDDLKYTRNGKEVTLDSDSRTEINIVRKIRPCFVKNVINYQGRKLEYILYPFSPKTIELPTYLTLSDNNALSDIEVALEMCFYQFKVSSYLDIAKNKLGGLSDLTGEGKIQVQRLEYIYKIIKLSTVTIDMLEKRKELLVEFSEKFRGDPWIPLLSSLVHFSNDNYEGALESLSNLDIYSDSIIPRASTTFFFQAMNHLRLLKKSKDLTEKTRRAANTMEALNQSLLSIKDIDNTSDYYHLSFPSIYIFDGITRFYLKDLDAAMISFEAARHTNNRSIKSRALNDIAYVHFIRGETGSAERFLIEALENDHKFAYARSNYGYVLIAQKKPKKAIQEFKLNAKDPLLIKNSYRDVILAQLAIGNIYSMDSTTYDSAFHYYQNAMEALNQPTYHQIDDRSLRLAFIHNKTADVYLDKKYYGLEMISLATTCRAYFDIMIYLENNPSDEKATKLKEDIELKIKRLTPLVEKNWFDPGQEGLFSNISKYFSLKTS